jgi:hypothetical protein
MGTRRGTIFLLDAHAFEMGQDHRSRVNNLTG